MVSIKLLALTLVTLVTSVIAFSSEYTPLAIILQPFSTQCLYYDLVSDDDTLVVSYQVLTGGNFEVDFSITGPDGKKIVDEKQKKYSDFLLKSFGLGQYSFCFSNNYGTSLKKVEFTLEPQNAEFENGTEEQDPDEIIANNAIEEIDRNLNKMNKVMNYLRAREWRNMYTVQSTESRLKWFSIMVMGFMVCVSVIQAIVIQFLFKSRQRNYV